VRPLNPDMHLSLPPRKTPRWLILSIAVAAGLSLLSIGYRHQVEARNRAVSLSAEMEVIESLAAAQGISLDEALERLARSGLSAVVLSEETLGQMISEGRLRTRAGALQVESEESAPRAERGLRMRFPGLQEPLRQGDLIHVPEVGSTLLRATSVGLNPRHAEAARAAGLEVVARAANPYGASEELVRGTIAWARESGAKVFLPMGDQVLGRRDALGTLVASLREEGMLYASPEFARIGGDGNVVASAPDLVVRLHAAQAAELDRIPLSAAVERYAKAARERNQRILLLRPVTFASEAPVESFAQFTGAVRDQVSRQGGVIADAHPFDEPEVPRLLFLLIGLSIAPVAWFAAASSLPRRDQRLAVAGFALVVALSAWMPFARPWVALVAAVAFPVAAFMVLDRRRNPTWLTDFLLVSAVSLVGGLVVAGLLNALPYFVRAAHFSGVKLAVFLPVVLVGGYFYWRLNDLRGALRSPITWGQAGIAFLILVGLGLMLTRTGNDNPAAVSGLELRFRSLLDAVLFVRPRTKEFLIGHPFLILGIGMLAHLRRTSGNVPPSFAGWTALALMVGAIGQTSIVNTMCHLHTPVQLSLARVGTGMVVGGILGGVLWSVVRRLIRREEA
jgi:hypothetical protein